MSLRLRLEAICGPGRVRGEGGFRASPPDEAALKATLCAISEVDAQLTLEGLQGTRPDPPAPGAPEEVSLAMEAFTAFEIHPASHLLWVGAGLAVSEIEQRLQHEGFSLRWGHLPPVPVGVWLAAHAGGIHSPRALPGHGPVVGIDAVLHDGTSLATCRAPRSATGPDLLHLFLGARARFGIMAAITLRVHPRPEQTRTLAWTFASHEEAVRVIVELLEADLWPDAMGLVDGGDEDEQDAVRLCWVLRGDAPGVDLRRCSAEIIARAQGGGSVGEGEAGAAGSSAVRAYSGSRSSARGRPSALDGPGAARAWLLYSQIGPLLARLREEVPLARLHLEAVAPEGVAAWIVGVDPARLEPMLQDLGAISNTPSGELSLLDSLASLSEGRM